MMIQQTLRVDETENMEAPDVRRWVTQLVRTFWNALLSDPARAAFVVGVAGLLSLMLVGLPLAIFDAFTLPAMIVPTAVVWLLLLYHGLRLTAPLMSPQMSKRLASILAMAVALSFTIFCWIHSSEHLLMDRDPGVYFITGKWLAAEGDLVYNSGLPAHLDEGSPDPAARLPQGLYVARGGSAHFQFQHSPALIFATANLIGGDEFMFKTPAVIAGIAILGIYLVGRRVAGALAGLVPIALAVVHPAFVHVAKDGYSEMLTLALFMGALTLWLARTNTTQSMHFFAVGLVIGGAAMTRIDGWLVALGFVCGLAYMVVLRSPRDGPTRRQVMALLAGLVITSGLGLIDLLARSPLYLRDLAASVIPAMIGLGVASLVAVFFASPGPRLRSLAPHLRRISAAAGLITIVGLGMYGLFVRPNLVVSRSLTPNAFVGLLQAREGLPVDPNRTYAEMSMSWFTRYQGLLPIIVTVAASGLAAWVMLRRPGDRRVPLVTTLIVVAIVYLWRPSITPDQLWAMRRYIPVVLPLAFVLLVWVARFVHRVSPLKLLVKGLALGILTFSLVYSIAIGWGVSTVRTQVGMLEAVTAFCDSLPTNGVVLMDQRALITLPGAIRTSCDVPTGSLEERGIVASVKQAGLVPVVVRSTSCGGDLPMLMAGYELPRQVLSGTPQSAQRERLRASVNVADGTEVRLARVPDSAAVSLQVKVETDWVPVDGFSVLATRGDYRNGMWLEYRSTGAVEIWVTTSEGQYVLQSALRIADGVEEAIGGYLDQGILHATCGGEVVATLPAPGDVSFDKSTTKINPLDIGEVDNLRFEGLIEVLADVPDAPVRHRST